MMDSSGVPPFKPQVATTKSNEPLSTTGFNMPKTTANPGEAPSMRTPMDMTQFQKSALNTASPGLNTPQNNQPLLPRFEQIAGYIASFFKGQKRKQDEVDETFEERWEQNELSNDEGSTNKVEHSHQSNMGGN